MADMQLPKGIIADLITPLKKDGGIDSDGLERHIRDLMPHVQAFLISGPFMGEGEALGRDRREELFVRTLSIVQSRIPVLAWITGKTVDETEGMLLLFRKSLETLRYTGPVFWADTPLCYHSNRGLETHYKRICSLAQEPFVLINDPAFIQRKEQPLKRVNIRTSILKGLASIEAIKGLIFSGSFERAYNYRKAVRTNPDFMIYDGDESNFLEHPSLNGVLSRGANLAPASWKTVAASSLNLNGNREDYPDRMRQILDAGRYVNGLRAIYNSYGPGFFKQVLAERGIIEHTGSPASSGKMVEDAKRVVGLMEERKRHKFIQ